MTESHVHTHSLAGIFAKLLPRPPARATRMSDTPHDPAPNSLPEDVLASLRSVAARHSRVPDEAEDLLQDALLEAVCAGRDDLTQAVNFRWVAGMLRNLGAMTARTAVRRRIRESRWSRDDRPQSTATPEFSPSGSANDAPIAWRAHPALVALPPSLRSVALLALAGHDRAEIAWLLDLTPTAMRQRISTLRKKLATRMDGDFSHPTNADLPLGLIRRALLPVVVATNSAGSHDPDGHLLTISRPGAHTLPIDGNKQTHDVLSRPSRTEPFP